MALQFYASRVNKGLRGAVRANIMTMGIKRITTSATLLFLMLSAAQAQVNITDSIGGNIGNRNEQTELSAESESGMQEAEATHENGKDEVWKRRAKYRNISYGWQTLKSDHTDIKSDMVFAFTFGRTYYLHKKPVAGIMKFGLDWSFMDVNFAKYPDFPASEGTTTVPDVEQADLGIMQLEAGMSVGPSLTINPVDRLKLSLYFRVTPSYSLIMQNHELYHHYATFFHAGFTAAYKVISLGMETRWCGATNYDGVALARLNNVYDDAGNFHDPFESYGVKMKTNTLRLLVGFRF